MSPSDLRRAIAGEVALAHAPLQPEGLLALVSGSVAEGLADDRSDVDMGIVFDALPDAGTLQDACRAAGGSAWTWQVGALAEGALVVSFRLRGIEVQIAYSDAARLQRDLDEVLVRHQPDTPLHKLAEGMLKAEPLLGADRLQALQDRIAAFPPALGLAMAEHFLGRVTLWRAVAQLLERDTLLWCRDLQVQLGYRLLGALAGLNGRYFTTFQFKRLHAFASRLPLAPPRFAQRLQHALAADAPTAFAVLHQLEGEVIELVQQRWPALDLAAVRSRHASYTPGPVA